MTRKHWAISRLWPRPIFWANRSIQSSRRQSLAGMILQQEIDQAVQSLWGGPLPDDGPSMLAAADDNSGHDGRYLCVILELNYFKVRFRPPPRTQAEIYHDILHVSRPTHDRHLRCSSRTTG